MAILYMFIMIDYANLFQNHSTINDGFRAVHEAAVVGDQKSNQFGRFICLANSSHTRFLAKVLPGFVQSEHVNLHLHICIHFDLRFVRVVCHHISGNRPWTNNVDPDASV